MSKDSTSNFPISWNVHPILFSTYGMSPLQAATLECTPMLENLCKFLISVGSPERASADLPSFLENLEREVTSASISISKHFSASFGDCATMIQFGDAVNNPEAPWLTVNVKPTSADHVSVSAADFMKGLLDANKGLH